MCSADHLKEYSLGQHRDPRWEEPSPRDARSIRLTLFPGDEQRGLKFALGFTIGFLHKNIMGRYFH